MRIQHIKFHWLLLGFFLALSIQHYGQSWYLFTGSVTNEKNGDPVPEYPVVISAADSGMVVMLQTNEQGTYFDSLFLNQNQTSFVTVEVIDCEGFPVVKTFGDLERLNVADFNICINQMDCVAYFEYELLEEIGVQFINLSLGDFSSWQWDFGDGTGSDEFHPQHFYNSPGTYRVSLTIQDSLANCFDTYAEWIAVGDTLNCLADFNFTLDTLNNQKNTYVFEDVSIGNPRFWYWDFGDGNISELQNPTHTYDSAGTYSVCLTIFSINGDFECEDKYCQTITTPDYFNFGGHAFLGDYPLNVDESDSSNIAVASLYRRLGNQWNFMDSREFWKFGYYWFADKLAGEYLIRVDLKPFSNDFGAYAPSYFGNAIGWANARIFTLGGVEQFDVNINLKPLNISSSGIGSISGMLEKGLTCDDEVSTEGSIIYLFDIDNNLIEYTYATPSGSFFFDGLPMGTYIVKVEMTGKFGEKTTVNLSDSNPSLGNLVLHYDCNAFVGVEELSDKQNLSISRIYPQPATNHISLDLLIDKASRVNFELMDINGITIFGEERWIPEGSQEVKIDHLNIKSGFYLLKIDLLETGSVFYRKILIYR